MRAARRRAGVLVGVVLAATATGCGKSVSATDAFRIGTQQNCLVHQVHAPQHQYEGGPKADTALELRFLGYYTAHGTEPFCDGKPATGDDRRWGALYVALTNNPAKVPSLRGTGPGS